MRYISGGIAIRDSDGTMWCSGGSKSSKHDRPGAKRRYESIDEAWLVAFTEFHRHGGILTPYQCHAHEVYRSYYRIIPHPNPWAFKPYWVRRFRDKGRKRVVCGGWHLAKRVYALPPGEAA